MKTNIVLAASIISLVVSLYVAFDVRTDIESVRADIASVRETEIQETVIDTINYMIAAQQAQQQPQQ